MLLALKQPSKDDGNIKALHPITGPPVNPDEAVVPMTGDVHLYPDQATWGTRIPLFFADSEGLDGGDQEPSSLSWQGPQNMPVRSRTIKWANQGSGLKREEVVANLFPKMLYTFSDVVVFVLNNPRYDPIVLRSLMSRILTSVVQNPRNDCLEISSSLGRPVN